VRQSASGLVQSIQARLVRHAKEVGADPNLVLSRYAAERLLYRLSRSRHADRFVLKGALLLLAWLGEMIRPTRDTDLLGFGDLSASALAETFRELCAIEVEPDGLVFDPSSVRVSPIRVEDAYGGQRVLLLAHLGPARLRLQVDVGIGDAVEPEPDWLVYPSLLDAPQPRLRAYRPETAIAEKTHAMVTLGTKNSRMRDFFDIRVLAARQTFQGAVLAGAIGATFRRRDTPLPSELPIALTPEFAAVADKPAQSGAFLRKSRLEPVELVDVIADLARFLAPALDAASRRRRLDATWPPGGPWR
jgi:predicted nucleotidyltransferase component of viral defense system